jgi:hypothetical protein
MEMPRRTHADIKLDRQEAVVRSLVVGLFIVTIGVVLAAPASAQPAPAQSPQPTAEQKHLRYQIGQMERTLEGAVEHGVKNMRDRIDAVVPTTMMVTENARVRGFRLDGYGVFFDVIVPDFDFTFTWTLRTLDQNDLGLESALKALRTHIEESGDRNLEQALKRIELQVSMPAPPASRPRLANANAAAGARQAAGSPAAAADDRPADPVLDNPQEAYRAEVKQALMDAMIDYSGPLQIGADEWLTVAARRNDERPQLAPADSESRTMLFRVKGEDLTAFRAGKLSREEALKRIDVRLF